MIRRDGRFICGFCYKSVSSEVPNISDIVLRAMLVCPECMEQIPEQVFEDLEASRLKKLQPKENQNAETTT